MFVRINRGVLGALVVLALSATALEAQELLPYSTWANPAESAIRDSLLQQPTIRPLPAITAAPAPAPAVPTPQPQAQPPLTGHAKNALRFYSRSAPRPSATETLQQLPRTRAPRPNLGPVRPASKPFQSVSRGPTVSPYLNLYLEEQNEAAPNYFAFVRPQLQQQNENERQQAELQRIRRQMQRAASQLGGVRPAGYQAPSTGHRTRFMNTGQYYGGSSP